MTGYHAVPSPHLHGSWDILCASGRVLDTLRTESGAEHALRLLDSGAAYIDTGATLGCRVRVRMHGRPTVGQLGTRPRS